MIPYGVAPDRRGANSRPIGWRKFLPLAHVRPERIHRSEGSRRHGWTHAAIGPLAPRAAAASAFAP